MMKKLLACLLMVLLVAAVFLTGLPTASAASTCAYCFDYADGWTEVKAADWAAGGAIATGHYVLTEDVSISAALTIGAGETVCLDLAGFDITASAGTSNPYRVLENSGTLSIMDSGETDGVISGGYLYAGSSVSGTLGGNIYNAAGSVFNLYGGTISGGTVHRKYHSKTWYGGGNIYSEGTVNIFGGTVTGGECYGNLVGGSGTAAARVVYLVGGNIFVSGGELNVKGGTVSDGAVDNQSYSKGGPGDYRSYGGNIYGNDSAKINISGGTISGGSAQTNSQGIDSTSGTEVAARAYGGNVAIVNSELEISGGTISGGIADATVDAYNGGTLTTKTINPYGGGIFTCSKSTLTITDGVITGGTAYQGGTIYCGKTLVMEGGEVSRGTADPLSTGLTNNYGGSIYAVSGMTLSGGTVSGGSAKRGGNVYIEGKTLTVSGGTISSGYASDRGGNIGTYAGTVNVFGGDIADGEADGYGGNIWLAGTLSIHNGNLTGGAAGNGGNICLISGASCYMYGGYVDGGEGGFGVYAYDGTSASPGNLYLYGGKVESIKTGSSGKNVINLYNGVVGSILNTKDKEITPADLDANADGSAVVPACAHITESEAGYIFWHHFEGACETCGHAYGDTACTLCNQKHTIPAGGTHTYEMVGEVATCVYCGLTLDGKVVAAIGADYYTDLNEALAAGEAGGKTVKLLRDLELEALDVYSKLDLNGYVLTVTKQVGAENKEAAILDSVGTGGIIGKVFTHADNGQLPVLIDGVYKFEDVTVKQIIETVSEDEKRVKITISDAAADTWLDEAIVNGDEIVVRITVRWTEGEEQKFHSFKYAPALVKAYALDDAGNSIWGEKMFTCAVTGLESIENCTMTAELVCEKVVVEALDVTPASNSSVSRYESGDGYTKVNNMLSWEKLNSFPIKHADMTEDEMRQLVVDFYNFSKTFVWVASEDYSYEIGAGYGTGNLQGGGVYAGFPYVSLASNSAYRMMDFMDEKTGVVNIAVAGANPMLFGNQCSLSAYWGWARVINSITACYTKDVVQKNGFVPVGPYTYPEDLEMYSADYGTGKIIEENGETVMYESYACLKLGDALVRNNPGGHVVMVAGTAYVVRDESGNIDPKASYILASDQTNGWTSATNAEGDTYTYTKNVNAKWNFKYLLDKGYLPHTFKEYSGADPIEDTVVTYSHQGETISRDQLFGSTIATNYALSDIYAVFTDSQGNEVYKLAVRAKLPVVQELTFAQEVIVDEGNTVTEWGSLDNLFEGETYTVEIIAQLGTGERPTLWKGTWSNG